METASIIVLGAAVMFPLPDATCEEEDGAVEERVTGEPAGDAVWDDEAAGFGGGRYEGVDCDRHVCTLASITSAREPQSATPALMAGSLPPSGGAIRNVDFR
jgi:hypothetical protein